MPRPYEKGRAVLGPTVIAYVCGRRMRRRYCNGPVRGPAPTRNQHCLVGRFALVPAVAVDFIDDRILDHVPPPFYVKGEIPVFLVDVYEANIIV